MFNLMHSEWQIDCNRVKQPALRMAKSLWSLGHFECSRVKQPDKKPELKQGCSCGSYLKMIIGIFFLIS